MLPREEIIALYTHAAIFVCPSVYEPFGIITSRRWPARRPWSPRPSAASPRSWWTARRRARPHAGEGAGRSEPADPGRFARDLAAGINALLADPARRAAMARRARRRVEEQFSWTSIARQTLAFYEELVGATRRP